LAECAQTGENRPRSIGGRGERVSKRAKVVVCESLSAEAERWLRGRCEVSTSGQDEADLLRALAGAHGLVVRTYTQVTADVLRGAPNLRVVGRAGVGIDNIDLSECRSRGIIVVYRPDANTQAVVEFVTAAVTGALRPPPRVTRPMSFEDWQTMRTNAAVARQMSERTLGVLGLGRIGRRIAEVARVIGFRTIYHDLRDVPPHERAGAEPVPMDDLFRLSDVLSVHVDGRASNRRLISERWINLMKADVLFVNTSRGFVVDARALARFLAANPEAGAYLDVHDPEPVDASYPLLGMPNAHLSPHVAGRTDAALREMSWVVRDVVAVLEGHAPEFPAPDQ